jgi:hypothetical protein
MLKTIIRNSLVKFLETPRVRNLFVDSLLTARKSQDWLRRPTVDPTYDFERAGSLYPLLAARFKKIVDEVDTYPQYVWGALNGISLAKAVDVERVSVIEFGVGGGNGLLALEKIALSLEQMYGVAVDVYGFDMGTGLPKPRDYRDLPNLWSEGYYPVDQEKLQRHLQRAQLVLGDVKDTVPAFVQSRPSPVAFIAFDLDFYSSTMAAFRVFEAETAALLPRIHCYFDDINGFTAGEHNGQRLAINDFNKSHELWKISQTYGLRYFIPEPFAREMWVEMIFIVHLFDHPWYGRNDGLVRSRGGDSDLDRPRRSWARIVR